MREWISLCESLSELAIEKTISNFGEAIKHRLDADKGLPANRGYDLDARGLINLCVAADPTPNSMYARRLLQWWLKGEFRYFEDIGKAYDVLELYHAGKSKLSPELRDIGRVSSFAELYEISKTLSQEDLRSNAQKDREEAEEYIKSGKAEIYYNSPEIKIIIPKTKAAAQYFGRNTQWCTSAKSNNQFDYYNKQGPLYIVLFKKENKRWQFHFESAQFMDEQDHELSSIGELYHLFPEEKWISCLKDDASIIQYIINPSEEIKRLAVQENGFAIGHIKDPSEELKRLAVQENGNAISHIEDPSEELKRLAVQENGNAIMYVKDPSEELKRLAVQQNGYAIRHIFNPSEELQKLAVKQKGHAIRHIKNPSEELKRLAIQQNGELIAYIKDPSEELKMLAVKQNAASIQYIENPSEEMQKIAVQKNGMFIVYIRNPSEEVKRLAIQQNHLAVWNISKLV